jgi:hypothetical protein
MVMKPEDWQEGLKDEQDRLSDRQEAPKIAGKKSCKMGRRDWKFERKPQDAKEAGR